MMSGTLVSGTLASATTPFSGFPIPGTRSVRGRAPSPESTSAMTGIMDTRPALPAASEAGSEATLERITALENQVSSLEAKVMELLVRLAEVSSCVSTSSTPRRQAEAGASPMTSNTTFEDLQARHLAHAPIPVNFATTMHLATREWVEGPKTPEHVSNGATQECELPDASAVQIATRERVESKTPSMLKHTVEHAEGFGPVNCSCSRPWSMDIDAVVPMEADAGFEVNAFSVHGIASRRSLF